MTNQDDLIDFIHDPDNINKAVEGSLDKRQKVLDAPDVLLAYFMDNPNPATYVETLRALQQREERLVLQGRIDELTRYFKFQGGHDGEGNWYKGTGRGLPASIKEQAYYEARIASLKAKEIQ